MKLHSCPNKRVIRRGLSDGARANHLRNVYSYRTRANGRPGPKIIHGSIVTIGQTQVFTTDYECRLYARHLTANFCRTVHFGFVVIRLSARIDPQK